MLQLNAIFNMVMRGAHFIKDKHLSVFILFHPNCYPKLLNNNEDISLSIFQ